MKLNYNLTDPLVTRQSALQGLKKIDAFFLSRNDDYSPFLSSKGIRDRLSMDAYLLDDPANEITLRQHTQSAINLLHKIVGFDDLYASANLNLSGQSLAEMSESIDVEEFVQSSGVAVKVDVDLDRDSGVLQVSGQDGLAKGKQMRLAFNIVWGVEVVTNEFDESDLVKVGYCQLLGDNPKLKEISDKLTKFQFIDKHAIGVDAPTGYSKYDLEDKDLFMKVGLFDDSDLMLLSGQVSRLPPPAKQQGLFLSR